MLQIALKLYVLFHLYVIGITADSNAQLPVKITQHPQSQVAEQGAQVIFRCEYETRTSFNSISTSSEASRLNFNDNIKITWLFNQRELNNDHPKNYRVQHNQLTVSSYKPRINSGEYRCLINNTLFSPPFVILSEPAELSLAYIEDFPATSESNMLSLSKGNVAIISCRLPASNPPAVPVFYHDSTEITNFGDFSRYRLFPSGNLQINNVNTEDNGSYRCSAKNSVTKEVKVNSVKTVLKISESFGTTLPTIAYVPTDTNRVKIGVNLTLECVANGAPVPLISWEKFGGILPPTRSQQVFGNLVLTNVQPEDKGTYVCRAETGPGQATFKTAMLDVFAAPSVIDEKPVVLSAAEGQQVKLVCPINARPRADITWFYQGRQILNDNVYTLQVVGDKSVLTMREFQASQSTGIFQCFAKNEYGSAQADLLVIPQDASSEQPQKVPQSGADSKRPMIMMGPQNTTIYEGQTVVLLCITNQVQGTQINWLIDDQIVEPTLMRRYEINQRLGNLRIVSVQKSDAGIYKCIASNEHGMATAEAYVIVANNGEELKAKAVAEPIIRKPLLSTPLASRPSIKQIGADKILLNWQLIDSITGLVIDSPQTLKSVAYFKVEYKTTRHTKKSRQSKAEGQPPVNVWLTIDEQIEPKKREYILTDLSKFETYRFRITTFYLNGDLTNSHGSLKFRLQKTWLEQATTPTMAIQPVDFHLSQVQVQLTQVWAIASSSLGLRWQLNTKLSPARKNLTSELDGFYIYYRKIDEQFSTVNADGQVSIDTQAIPDLPIVNYTRIKVPTTSSLIDSYMIENLVEASVYEIKMSCYNLIGDLCAFSKPLYGITLKTKILAGDMDTQLASEPTSVVVESAQASSNEILFAALGTILAILSLVLIVFVIMCVIRHQQHKRLLIQLQNTSQKMTSSSCPTLIYEDSLRQNCQQQRHHKVNMFNSQNSSQDSNSTNSQSMSTTTSSMITPPQTECTPSHVLLMNGTTVQAPPPIPQVPPPTSGCYTDTMNKMNINLNPLLSANQENFYHTLSNNNHNNVPSLPNQMTIDDQNPYSDYNTVTMNLRAQLLLKQQQQQQQQQFFINTLRAMNMKNHQQSYMETATNPKSPSMTHSMRRNTSISSSKKSKKSTSRTRDRSNDPARQNQIDENFVQPQPMPSNYYLMPSQANQMMSLEATLAAQNQMLFNQSALNQPGIYLLNSYLPTDPLMFNNMFSNQQSGQMTAEQVAAAGEMNKSTVDTNANGNNSMTIEEQEKEPLNQ